MNEEKFITKIKSFENYEKFVLLVYYFYHRKDVFYDYEKTLTFLDKLNKTFNVLKRSASNEVFADSLHAYVQTAIRKSADNYNEKKSLLRSFDASIKISNFLFFAVSEYVSVEKKLFNVELKFDTYTFTTMKEMFAVFNLTRYAIKHKIFDSDSKQIHLLLVKSFAQNLQLCKMIEQEKNAPEIIF